MDLLVFILSHIRKNFLFTFFLVLAVSNAQNNNPQINRVQRSIHVFNLAQQIVGYSPSTSDRITIGVLGTDRTVIDLRAMAQKRTIAGMPVSVLAFQKVKDITDIDILYVHSKNNFDINYILNSINNKHILLITEEYKYNASMINIVDVGDGFEYEINKGLLSNENFSWAPSLEINAISSAQKWKLLFKDSQELLKVEKQQSLEKDTALKIQDTVLKEQQKRISESSDTIVKQKDSLIITQAKLNRQQDSILKLWSLNNIQAAKYEDKVLLEQALQNQILQQVSFLKDKQQQIAENVLVLEQQKKNIEQQQNKIEAQKSNLDSQEETIDQQRTIVFLLALIAGSLLLSAFLLYSSNRKAKKLNNQLISKNLLIAQQSKELSQKNDELEQFAYIASHDLKEPINTISSLIGMLEDDYGESFNDTTKQSFTFMTESVTRMRALIEALLKHSKLGVSHIRESINCGTLLKTVTSDLNTLITNSNAIINVSELPTINASPTEMRQVFQNLIVNAIKFTEKETAPIITIDCSLIQDTQNHGQQLWQFSIGDNGIGIAEKYQEKIFAIFQRLHNKELYEGTGIGLAHCKKIIDAHGGTIWVESQEGEGSTFFFTIPKK